MFMSIGFCIIDAKSTPPPPPPPPPPRDRKTSLKSGAPPSGVGRVDSEVDSGLDADGMRAFALSRPDFKFALLGSRSSPRWNAFADS